MDAKNKAAPVIDSETEIIPVFVRKQVFYSPAARRGLYVLVLVCFLLAVIAVGWQWGLASAAKPLPTAARYNTSASYASSVATELARCGGEHGEFGPGGTIQVPVIGQGVFQRIVRIVASGSTTYAVDPFTGKVVQPLTGLQQHATRDCRYAIQEYGAVPQDTVVLAYDNSPTAQWTPQLLGILQAYHVHATFFNTGTNILAMPDIFNAEISTGNVVGNETLDNPELTNQTGGQARQEIVTNARIIATTAKYQSHLFYTPSIGTSEQAVAQNLFATLVGQQLGFVDVNLTNASWDYQVSAHQVPSLQRNGAGVVLLIHDGGGSLGNTLQTSVNLIRQAMGLGYKFMTIPQLLGSQDFPGPVAGPVQPSMDDRIGYVLYWGPHIMQAQLLQDVMRYMTIFIGLITAGWILAASWGRFYNYRKPPTWHPDKVSVLIPAWNESKVIRRTVESILRYSYDFELEIVVVDDGSTDNTWEILQQLKAEYAAVKIYDKENGGKAKALNYGLFIGVTTDYTLIIDADTIVADGETIPRLVRWFADPKIGVVAGRTKAGYRGKTVRERMLAEFQSAEYDLGIAVLRTAQDWMNGIVIVPGSCSMFRTALLREVGGFKSHLIAEDAAAGMELRRRFPGMRIRQDITAVALTEVPLTVKTLCNQWRRWTFGVMQVMMDHREIFVRPDKYGGLTLQLWWSLYGLIVPTLLLPVTYLMLVVTAFNHNWRNLLVYPLIFVIYRVATTLVSIVIMREWMNPLTAIWYRIVNDPLQMYLAVTCWYRVLSGNVQPRKIWSKLPRQGATQEEVKSTAKSPTPMVIRSPRHQVDADQVKRVTADQVTQVAADQVTRADAQIGADQVTQMVRADQVRVPPGADAPVDDATNKPADDATIKFLRVASGRDRAQG
ncbi:MAG: glycosyltransferase [Streptosporangiaceae bacterium]|nr:glycosyltransferase [Streptosporangiaceae bacterium]